jgi:hypothetical protein
MKRLVLALTAVFAFTAAPRLHAASNDSLVDTLVSQAPGLRNEVLRLALNAAHKAEDNGLITRQNLLTVIDYSIPSSQPRLFVFDLAAHKLLFRELVAHGKNSGDNRTSAFSNDPGSLETSLGLFVTAEPYIGGNGYSLRLRGLEEGFNDNAWDRMIVMHGAKYVSEATVSALGRLGRSWGCPAVRPEIAKKLIDTLRGGSPVFAYYPDQNWLASSHFLPHGGSAPVTTAVAAR